MSTKAKKTWLATPPFSSALFKKPGGRGTRHHMFVPEFLDLRNGSADQP